MQQIKQAIESDLGKTIDYEWTILQEAVNRKYIRGIYSSLDRLLRHYKKQDIKM